MATACCRDVIGHHVDCEAVPQLRQPVDEGWYWYRKSDQHQWSMLQVWQENGHRLCAPQRMRPDTHNHIENFDGEWHGPLTPPCDRKASDPKFVITLTDEEFDKLSDRSEHLHEVLMLSSGARANVIIQRDGA